MDVERFQCYLPTPLVRRFRDYVFYKYGKVQKVFSREVALALLQYLKSKGKVDEELELIVKVYCWDILSDDEKKSVRLSFGR